MILATFGHGNLGEPSVGHAASYYPGRNGSRSSNAPLTGSRGRRLARWRHMAIKGSVFWVHQR